MIKVKRSNSLILKERNLPRKKQNRAENGNFHPISERIEKIQNETDLNPNIFFNFIPIVQINEWSQITENQNKTILQNSIAKLENLIQNAKNNNIKIQEEVSVLVEKSPFIVSQIFLYRGRGLNQYRKTLFLISYTNSLHIKLDSMEIRDNTELIEHCSKMIDALKASIDLSGLLVSIDIGSYLGCRKSLEKKIESMKKKMHYLSQQKLQWPYYVPPPKDFAMQLIYPTSDTVSIFKNLANNAQSKTIEKIYQEFKEMTDDADELDTLLDHAFDFGWAKTEFPYIGMKPTPIPLFLNVTARALNVEYLPHKYLDIPINELQSSDWPFASVVDIIQSLLFEINPFRMAKVFNEALNEISKCVQKINDDSFELDFDHIFSIVILCLMASGILEEERILLYLSQISLIDINDMSTRVGATYAASALNHILSLDEEKLTEISQWDSY